MKNFLQEAKFSKRISLGDIDFDRNDLAFFIKRQGKGQKTNMKMGLNEHYSDEFVQSNISPLKGFKSRKSGAFANMIESLGMMLVKLLCPASMSPVAIGSTVGIYWKCFPEEKSELLQCSDGASSANKSIRTRDLIVRIGCKWRVSSCLNPLMAESDPKSVDQIQPESFLPPMTLASSGRPFP